MMPTCVTRRSGAARGGFTLIELLITISIIALMASMLGIAVYSAQETAKEAKTRQLIAKLDAIIKNRWEQYRTRRVPVSIPAPDTTNATNYKAWKLNVALLKMYALRDLMRMELPDRWKDVTNVPVAPITFNAASNNPQSFLAAPQLPGRPFLKRICDMSRPRENQIDLRPQTIMQGAECLYLIVMAALAEEGDAREVFRPSDIQDTDGDSIPEFVDAWGKPIKFLRWAPGFQSSELQVLFQANASGSGTINITGPGLSSDPGVYIGGAVIEIDTTTTGNPFDLSKTARITNYSAGTLSLAATAARIGRHRSRARWRF